MAERPPEVSPDGRYWWDGRAWQPMFLPDAAGSPGAPAGTAAGPTATAPPPAIAAHAPATQRRVSTTSLVVVVAAIVVLAIIAGGLVLWALQPPSHQTQAGGPAVASSSPSVAPSASASPSPPKPAARALTARLSGDYCPVTHVGDAACWKGSVINTGPAIQNLAMIFIVGSPYSNWFATHANAALSGFYSSPGCQIDSAHARILCGPVGAGQEVDAYLGGDISKRGYFRYAVKFADIGGGSTVYIDQHANGTHDVVSWSELIT